MKLSLTFLDRWESSIFNKYSNGSKVSKNLPAFISVRTKIGYASYILALFVINSAIFIILAFVAIFIIMAVLALWIAWFFISNGSSKGKKARIHYSDGSSEDADITGRGPTGEIFVKGRDSGREFQK